MRWKPLATFLFLCLTWTTLCAHDLFLKLNTYVLQPHSTATVRFLNGSFQKSESGIAPARFRDVSIVSPAQGRTHPATTQFQDEGNTTGLNLETAEAGTYIVGASTTPREIDLKVEDFNRYLEHDGIPDMLAARRKSGQLKQDVRERYSKHVKAIFRVGSALTDSFKTSLGYPVELIPLQNPYALGVGQTLEILSLLDGQPIANQFVMAAWEFNGKESPPLTARTNAKGIVRIPLKSTGKWCVKMIHMVAIQDANLNYESKWATLTFEVK